MKGKNDIFFTCILSTKYLLDQISEYSFFRTIKYYTPLQLILIHVLKLNYFYIENLNIL